MGASNTETLLFQVDIQANNARLAELAKEARTAKEEFATLQKQVKAGAADAALLDTASVRLKAALAANSQEARVLTKANADQVRAMQASEGSIEQLRAQLSLGTAEYNKLSKAERENSEEGQRLAAANRSLSDNLKALEGAIGDTRRNVGNYGAAIEPLLAQLVKLEEQQRAAAPDSAPYKAAQLAVIGFQQTVNEAAAKAGLAQEELNAKYAQTAAAIRPATAALVQLENEQAKVEKGTEAYTQIGFKIGKASKAVEQATSDLKKATPETKRFGSGLLEAARESDTLGGAIGKVTEYKDKFTKASELAKLAIGGEATALGVLRVALIATGLGALVVVLGSVVAFLTKTVEGTNLVSNVMAGVGAVVNVVIDRFGQFGKAVTQVLSGDFSGAAATAKAAFAGIGTEIQREVKIAGDLSKARQQLDRDTARNIDTNKRLLNEVERLKNVRDNEFNTIEVRRKANEDAFRVELEREKTLADLARRKIAILQQEIDLRGGIAKASVEQLRELGEAQNELSDIQEDAAGKQNELITNRFQLAKEATEKQAEAEQAAITTEIARLQTRLLNARTGSQQELEIREALVVQQGKLEAAAANKTAADRKLIVAKSLAEITKLEDEFLKARQDAAAKAQQEGDAQRIAALGAEQKRQADALKQTADNYARDEAFLARYLDRRRTALDNDYAEGKLSKQQYDGQIQQLDETSFGARLVLAKQYGKDTTKLEADQAAKHREVLVKTREEEKKLNEERVRNAESFGAEVGKLFADVLTDSGESLQDFAAKVLVLILDSLEKVTLAAAAEATAKSIGMNPTPAGFAQAAVTSGLIIAAFESAKAVITASTAKPFNTGGRVPGQGNTDTVPAILTPGEIVMNKASSEALAPVLGYLNSLYGGVNFAPGFAPAVAGRVPGQIDGGLAARQLGSAQGIDYKKLAEACAQTPVYANPTLLNKPAEKLAKRIAQFTFN